MKSRSCESNLYSSNRISKYAEIGEIGASIHSNLTLLHFILLPGYKILQHSA